MVSAHASMSGRRESRMRHRFVFDKSLAYVGRLSRTHTRRSDGAKLGSARLRWLQTPRSWALYNCMRCAGREAGALVLLAAGVAHWGCEAAKLQSVILRAPAGLPLAARLRRLPWLQTASWADSTRGDADN